MQVQVLLFGVLKDSLHSGTELVELCAGARVGDLLEHYRRRSTRSVSESLLASLAVAVNREYAGWDFVLSEGDEVALLPPVSGGADAESGAGADSDLIQAEWAAGQRVALISTVIPVQRIVESLKQGPDGAVVVFDGIVRDNTRGRRTLYLDYESYPAMAIGQMHGLAVQAMERFAVRDAVIVHRVGRIGIGESSVLIAVASAHRGAAFDACRFLIDTLKQTVPIWKKEYFVDGAVWAAGEPFPAELLPIVQP